MGGDLDIVGPKSLFQFLNDTNTWHGRQRLAEDLLHQAHPPAEILNRQQAILELSQEAELGDLLKYQLSQIGTNSAAKKLTDGLQDSSLFCKSKAIKLFLLLAPLVTLVLYLLIVILQLKQFYQPAFFGVVAQIVIWLAGAPKTQGYLGAAANLPNKLAVYHRVIQLLKAKTYTPSNCKKFKNV